MLYIRFKLHLFLGEFVRYKSFNLTHCFIKIGVMEKPICLREETWQFLKGSLNRLPQADWITFLHQLGYQVPPSADFLEILEIISERPGSFLIHAGILARPDLLESTVIADQNGLEYFIDQETAYNLESTGKPIKLLRLYDKKPFVVSTAQLIEYINESFDQL